LRGWRHSVASLRISAIVFASPLTTRHNGVEAIELQSPAYTMDEYIESLSSHDSQWMFCTYEKNCAFSWLPA
jgi:hypothetical protein